MIDRPRYLRQIQVQFDAHPVVAILGSRQCGKTTLARMYADRFVDEPVTRFDLEDPTHLARLESPMLALENLEGLVMLDEVQRSPGERNGGRCYLLTLRFVEAELEACVSVAGE